MTQANEAQTVEGAGGPASPAAGARLLGALRSQSPWVMLGLAVVTIAIVGLGSLSISMALHGNNAQATDQGTDYVAGFEKTCIPNLTQKFIVQGVTGDQAKTQATDFCQCVGTNVSAKLTPEMLAQARQSKQIPPTLALEIAKSVKSCKKL